MSLYSTSSFVLPRQYMPFHSVLLLHSHPYIPAIHPFPLPFILQCLHPPYWTSFWSLFSASENYMLFLSLISIFFSPPIYLPHTNTTANLWTRMRQSSLSLLQCNMTLMSLHPRSNSLLPFSAIWYNLSLSLLLSLFLLSNIFHSNILPECNKAEINTCFLFS